ncbi:MAG: hypothetical protein R3C62_20855 [Chloroflexota bacterium]
MGKHPSLLLLLALFAAVCLVAGVMLLRPTAVSAPLPTVMTTAVAIAQPTILPSDTPTATAIPPTATPTAVPSPTATPIPPTATPSPTAVPQANWPPSLLTGDLQSSYPLSTTVGSLVIHYQPGTYPADHLGELTAVLPPIITDLETALGGGIGHPIDLYLAGTLFADNPALQGLTQSYEFQTAVLVNGAFHPGERDYILAHELAHIIATHRLGPASSPLLHEGLAVYLPQAHLVQTAGYLPHTTLCAIAQQSGQFSPITELAQQGYGPTTFGGHIRTFIHYNLSGCFVGYLLETYGLAQFDAVYESGDYVGIYGRSLAELESDWQATLTNIPIPIDGTRFLQQTTAIATAYDRYLAASVGGQHANWPAYLQLNHARLANNQGHLDEAAQYLAEFETLLTTPP